LEAQRKKQNVGPAQHFGRIYQKDKPKKNWQNETSDMDGISHGAC
jgi:hypothetical protein